MALRLKVSEDKIKMTLPRWKDSGTNNRPDNCGEWAQESRECQTDVAE